MNDELATLFSVPVMVTTPSHTVAAARTGKFCRPLAPASPSPASLAVTPCAPRSMPRSDPSPSLSWIELPTMVLPEPDSTRTPQKPPMPPPPAAGGLNAMTFPSSASRPPIRLPDAADVMRTPAPALPSAEEPSAATPMRLPWTALPVAAVPLILTPWPVLPLMTLPRTTLSAPSFSQMPSPPLPAAADPEASVPM